MHEGHWNWKDVSAIARFELGPSLVEQQQRQQSHAELAELLTLTSKSRSLAGVFQRSIISEPFANCPTRSVTPPLNRPELAGLAVKRCARGAPRITLRAAALPRLSAEPGNAGGCLCNKLARH